MNVSDGYGENFYMENLINYGVVYENLYKIDLSNQFSLELGHLSE